MRWRFGKFPVGLGTAVLLAAGAAAAPAQSKLRTEVERELTGAEAAFRSAPKEAGARRAYARVLYQLGNVWQATEIIAPLATAASADTADLGLGAQLAYLTGNYDRAEGLY